MIHLFSALPCEAKPIVDYFKLKRQLADSAFAIYSTDSLSLTVSGIGKNGIAAAVAYSHLRFSKQANSVYLNIGVAGDQAATIGSPFLAEKITDAESLKNHYPIFVSQQPCQSRPLTTFSQPQMHYPENSLCDMEASAFFETASRFSTGELIHCLKVVSDNKEQPMEKVNPKQVSALIKKQLPLIETVIKNLAELANSLPPAEIEIPLSLSERWHFTVSEQRQLKALLQRWQLLAPQRPIEGATLPETTDRKKLLRWLNEKVDSFDLILVAPKQ
jgi:nucleoside phosphorylase